MAGNVTALAELIASFAQIPRVLRDLGAARF